MNSFLKVSHQAQSEAFDPPWLLLGRLNGNASTTEGDDFPRRLTDSRDPVEALGSKLRDKRFQIRPGLPHASFMAGLLRSLMAVGTIGIWTPGWAGDCIPTPPAGGAVCCMNETDKEAAYLPPAIFPYTCFAQTPVQPCTTAGGKAGFINSCAASGAIAGSAALAGASVAGAGGGAGAAAVAAVGGDDKCKTSVSVGGGKRYSCGALYTGISTIQTASTALGAASSAITNSQGSVAQATASTANSLAATNNASATLAQNTSTSQFLNGTVNAVAGAVQALFGVRAHRNIGQINKGLSDVQIDANGVVTDSREDAQNAGHDAGLYQATNQAQGQQQIAALRKMAVNEQKVARAAAVAGGLTSALTATGQITAGVNSLKAAAAYRATASSLLTNPTYAPVAIINPNTGANLTAATGDGVSNAPAGIVGSGAATAPTSLPTNPMIAAAPNLTSTAPTPLASSAPTYSPSGDPGSAAATDPGGGGASGDGGATGSGTAAAGAAPDEPQSRLATAVSGDRYGTGAGIASQSGGGRGADMGDDLTKLLDKFLPKKDDSDKPKDSILSYGRPDPTNENYLSARGQNIFQIVSKAYQNKAQSHVFLD